MAAWARARLAKHREAVLYLVCGGLTTLLSQGVFMALIRLLPSFGTPLPSALSWVAGVVFAYAVNRRWVFGSRTQGPARRKEMTSFVGARVFSGLLDMAVVFVAADLLRYNADIVKLASNLLIVVGLNFVMSKYLVFRARKNMED